MEKKIAVLHNHNAENEPMFSVTMEKVRETLELLLSTQPLETPLPTLYISHPS